MKKVMLALLGLMVLSACTGSYKQGACEYDYLLHPQISITRLVGCQ